MLMNQSATVDASEIDAIVRGEAVDPFGFLGPHPTTVDGQSGIVVRFFVPNTVSGWLQENGKAHLAEQVGGLRLPTLERLGLGSIIPIPGVAPYPQGFAPEPCARLKAPPVCASAATSPTAARR